MITYQQEFLTLCRPDLELLIQEEWDEVGSKEVGFTLDPDWDWYDKAEDLGLVQFFTARDGNKLVGYMSLFIDSHRHSKGQKFARNDLLYVTPEYRSKGVGTQLIKFVEECLKEDEVKVLAIGFTNKNDISTYLTTLGFTPSELVYTKVL